MYPTAAPSARRVCPRTPQHHPRRCPGPSLLGLGDSCGIGPEKRPCSHGCFSNCAGYTTFPQSHHGGWEGTDRHQILSRLPYPLVGATWAAHRHCAPQTFLPHFCIELGPSGAQSKREGQTPPGEPLMTEMTKAIQPCPRSPKP